MQHRNLWGRAPPAKNSHRDMGPVDIGSVCRVATWSQARQHFNSRRSFPKA